MSTIDATTRYFGIASDYCNAILVKETRQALKSRQFLATYMLLLVASWTISVFVLLQFGEAIEFGAVGRWLFLSFFYVLGVAIFVVVPTFAFRSLIAEREDNTWDVLSISTLSPRQIVIGKMLNSVVQLFLYYSAIAPFIAFTSLLEGFDFAQTIFMMTMALVISMSLSMYGLFLSVLAKHRFLQTLIFIGLLGSLLFWLFPAYGIAAEILRSPLPFDEPGFWWGVSSFVLAAASFFFLFMQLTIARLTFESDNRSTGIRGTIFGQLIALFLILAALFYFERPGFFDEIVFSMAIAATFYFTFVGLFTTTESEFLSRRIRRQQSRHTLLRILKAPFMPGGARGYLYLLLSFFVCWWATNLLITLDQAWTLSSFSSSEFLLKFSKLLTFQWEEETRVLSMMMGYAVIYLGIGSLLGRLAQKVSSEIRPAHVRVLTLFIILGGTVFPMLFLLIDLDIFRDNPIVTITSPIIATIMVVELASSSTIFLSYIVVWISFLVVALNVPAMVHAVKVLAAKPPAPAKPYQRQEANPDSIATTTT